MSFDSEKVARLKEEVYSREKALISSLDSKLDEITDLIKSELNIDVDFLLDYKISEVSNKLSPALNFTIKGSYLTSLSYPYTSVMYKCYIGSSN